MKKLIYLIVVIVALALIIAGCGIPVVPPVEQNEPGTLPNKTTIDVNPGDSIQVVINAANSGDIINVAAGIYNEGSLVFNKDDITLVGSGAGTTIIITSSNTYGVSVPSGVDDITIKDFTIQEDATYNSYKCSGTGSERFHLKISHNSGFTLENVNLEGPGKDNSCIVGLDLNSVQNVIIRNVHISGYSTNGVGVIAKYSTGDTATSNLLFENVIIEDNGYTNSTGWAGISFYTMGGGGGTGNITDVRFEGTNTISNNPMGIYVENVGGNVYITGTGTTTLSGNDIPLVAFNLGALSIVDAYAEDVFDVPFRLDNVFASPLSSLVSYWHNVASSGLAANNPLANGNPVIFNLTNGEWYVVEGMGIQAAIDAASDGDTINVATGTYYENVVVNKSLSLLTNPGAVLNGNSIGNGFLIKAANITISGFEITNFQIGIRSYGGPSNFGNLTISNVNNHNNLQNGILIVHDVFDTVTIEDCQITGNSQNGIGIANAATIGTLFISGTQVSQNGRHGLFLANTNITSLSIVDSNFNESQTNGYSGITFASTESNIGALSMTGGSLSGNKGCGLSVVQVPSQFVSILLNGVEIYNNRESGIMLGGNALTGALTVENCSFQVNGWEHIDLSGAWWGKFSVTGNTFITENTFSSGPWCALYIGDSGMFGGEVAVNKNNFLTGNWGIYNCTSKVVDATCNWWGNKRGPSRAMGAAEGHDDNKGDRVSPNVKFAPWSKEEFENK
jgi:nitrous oxidase accessory protein NosD